MDEAACEARPENERVFFRGAGLRPAAVFPGRAPAWAEDAEWCRPVVAAADWRRPWPAGQPPGRRWTVDFPPGTDPRRAALDRRAWRRFTEAGGRIPRRGPAAELRIALAKVDRFLAAPAAARSPQWRWVPSRCLPESDLCLLALDDEFLAGVLASPRLEAWLRARRRRLTRTALDGFRFPWPPRTPRGALSRDQEEIRAAVVAAVRRAATDDGAVRGGEELAAAVARAYGESSR